VLVIGAYFPFFINIGSIGNPLGTIDWFVAYLMANFTAVLVSLFEDLLSVFIVIVMREQIKKLLEVNQSLRSAGSLSSSVGDVNHVSSVPISSPECPVNEEARKTFKSVETINSTHSGQESWPILQYVKLHWGSLFFVIGDLRRGKIKLLPKIKMQKIRFRGLMRF
jgi:hypothetical protein